MLSGKHHPGLSWEFFLFVSSSSHKPATSESPWQQYVPPQPLNPVALPKYPWWPPSLCFQDRSCVYTPPPYYTLKNIQCIYIFLLLISSPCRVDNWWEALYSVFPRKAFWKYGKHGSLLWFLFINIHELSDWIGNICIAHPLRVRSIKKQGKNVAPWVCEKSSNHQSPQKKWNSRSALQSVTVTETHTSTNPSHIFVFLALSYSYEQ